MTDTAVDLLGFNDDPIGETPRRRALPWAVAAIHRVIPESVLSGAFYGAADPTGAVGAALLAGFDGIDH